MEGKGQGIAGPMTGAGIAAKALQALPALVAAGDWPAAERLLRRAAAAKGAPAPVFYNLAKVLEAAGKGAQAGTWLRRAVERAPDYAVAWFELGRWMLETGDLPGAAEAFARAAAADPGDADAWRNLGRLALRLGQWQRAAEAWARLGPGDPEAAAGAYRAAAELGQAGPAETRALLEAHPGPASLQAVTHAGRGHLPFVLPAGGAQPRR